MGLYKEGIKQAEEASGTFERVGDTANQARCLIDLALLLDDDRQFDVGEEAASRAIDLLPENGQQLPVCQGHYVLGKIYTSKGNTEKAIHHFEVALGIVSSLGEASRAFWIHFHLAKLFSREGRFDDAHTHVEQAKSHAVHNTYLLARASLLQARFWYRQCMFEEAKYEASRVLSVFEKLGVTSGVERARKLLGQIDRNARGNCLATPDELDDDLWWWVPQNNVTCVCVLTSCWDGITEFE